MITRPLAQLSPSIGALCRLRPNVLVCNLVSVAFKRCRFLVFLHGVCIFSRLRNVFVCIIAGSLATPCRLVCIISVCVQLPFENLRWRMWNVVVPVEIQRFCLKLTVVKWSTMLFSLKLLLKVSTTIYDHRCAKKCRKSKKLILAKRCFNNKRQRFYKRQRCMANHVVLLQNLSFGQR